MDRAEKLARRSVDLAPTRAEAWAALGWILHWQQGPNAGLNAFERAFELNPGFVDGRYALLLSHAGRATCSTLRWWVAVTASTSADENSSRPES